MSTVPIPGTKRMRDALSRMSEMDGGKRKYVETEKKRKKDYGTSDRVLRPRMEGNKVS